MDFNKILLFDVPLKLFCHKILKRFCSVDIFVKVALVITTQCSNEYFMQNKNRQKNDIFLYYGSCLHSNGKKVNSTFIRFICYCLQRIFKSWCFFQSPEIIYFLKWKCKYLSWKKGLRTKLLWVTDYFSVDSLKIINFQYK